MYKYYNANKYNLSENDCTVRAISLAEGYSWDCTYSKLSDLAQSKGTMMDDREFIIDYLDSRYRRIPFKGTVGQASGLYKDNILLITMKGHIVCSVYGTVYDSFDCRNREVEYLWIV